MTRRRSLYHTSFFQHNYEIRIQNKVIILYFCISNMKKIKNKTKKNMGDMLSKFVDPNSPGQIIVSYLPSEDHHILGLVDKPLHRFIGTTSVRIQTSDMTNAYMHKLKRGHITAVTDVCLIINDNWINIDDTQDYAEMLPHLVRLTLTQAALPTRIHGTSGDIATSSTDLAGAGAAAVHVPRPLLDWAPKLRVLDIDGIETIDPIFDMFPRLFTLKDIRLQWHHMQRLGELTQWNPRLLDGISNIHVTMDVKHTAVSVHSIKWLWGWATSTHHVQRLTVVIERLTATIQTELGAWLPSENERTLFKAGGLSHFHLIIHELDRLQRINTIWDKFINRNTHTVVSIHALEAVSEDKIEMVRHMLMRLVLSASITTELQFTCTNWNNTIAKSFRDLLHDYIFGIVSVVQRIPPNKNQTHWTKEEDNSNLLDRIPPCKRRMHVTVRVPTQQVRVDAYHMIFQPQEHVPLYFAVLSEMMERGYMTFRILSDDNADNHAVLVRPDAKQKTKRHKL